uniref:Maco-A 29 n=1 Tax=Mamestra configurata nucleopolyhedrovirus TaxID=207830 RepID=A0A7G7Y807_NPVMC|nr:maco-A 29 [Mamestra configurata nucleopolyhedrovirus A]
MGFDGLVTIYFLDKDKNVIKSEDFSCHKMCPEYLQMNIVPNAEFVQVCFSNDEQSCECIYCIKAAIEEDEAETDEAETEEEAETEKDEEPQRKRRRTSNVNFDIKE